MSAEDGVRRSAAGAARAEWALYAALAALPVVVSLPRLLTGPWYLAHNPFGGVLLDGWPAAWESVYNLVHFPTFLGDGPPKVGIASIQYRTFLSLWLATMLYGWTGSAFWSLATVDWLFWFLGGVAMYHLALRLGSARPAAAIAALLAAAAPIFAAGIWRMDLRVSNSAGMALGLWAAVVLVEEHRSRLRLGLGLGFLLFVLSLSYNYQWLLAPMLIVLAVADGRLTLRQSAAVVLGAVVLYAAATATMKEALVLAGLGPTEYRDVVAQGDELLLARLAAVRSPAQLLRFLPDWYHARLMAEAYTPPVLLSALVGLGLLPRRTQWLALVAVAATLLVTVLYAQPWVAMSAYPLVYVGAGTACFGAGRAAARAVAAFWPGARVGRLTAWVARGLAGSLAVCFGALTNLDLVGRSQFLNQWWDHWERIVF